jgi:hypothetical protein
MNLLEIWTGAMNLENGTKISTKMNTFMEFLRTLVQ